jgi:ASC-1-like (ASCH) protein
MDHLAIMKKNRWLTQRILTGQKTIETRRYMNKSAPWDKIKSGDTVYFKDSWSPVTVKATVSQIEQFADLDETKRQEILKKYSYADIWTATILPEILDYVKGKKYCIIIHLKKPQAVEPFEVDKSWYGSMSAWISLPSIEKIRI